MGGLGKTTLAQSVYNGDERVETHFNVRAWACVSEETDNAKITKGIIESATRRACQLDELEPLQGELKEQLDGKKFLIVLDDVWNEKRGDWEQLRRPFQFGERGSRVIVTARLEKVSAYHLGCLENEYCWSILKQQATVEDVRIREH
ncbi:PREDICTED: putative disease resistance protein RGA3 [Nelumbo nucifera]|uniref:Disease resistance protein RGA3 n=1 Tax=Nelumbo nucifera TaxID=4432 RepID=A0A1U8BGY3_NELNU|nr:PREDICTED: putative disease resistance protein RGA3 [Nelumbo nucifera]